MSDGGGQFCHLFLGLDNAGFNIAFKAAGTSTDKQIWTDEGRSNPVYQVKADSKGLAIWYGDGDYDLIVTTNAGDPLYTLPNVKITSDTATMWEGNFGTSLPVATEKNRNQLFALLNSSNVFQGLYINSGTIPGFVLISGTEEATHTLTDISSATGYSPATTSVWFDSTDIDMRRDFGVPVDGSDASVAMTNAWNAYVALSYPGVLKFPARSQIQIDTATTFTFPASNSAPLIIDGNGCRIRHNVASASEAALKFTGPGSSILVRHVELKNFQLKGQSGALATCLEIDGRDDWFQGWTLNNVYGVDFSGNGLQISNIFEATLNQVQMRAGAGNIGYYPMLIQTLASSLSSDNVTSLRMNECITFNGRQGCRMVDVGDLHMVGGTFVDAYYEGCIVTSASAFTGNFDSNHFENNNTANITGIRGLNIGNMWGGTIKDQRGDMKIALNEGGNTQSSLTIIGGYVNSAIITGNGGVVFINRSSSNTDTLDSTIRKVEISNAYVSAPVDKHQIQTLTGISATPILTDGSEVRISAPENGFNVTINAPTTGPANNPTTLEGGEELVFYIPQDATGGRTITWNAIYVNMGTPGYTANTYSTFTFRYILGKWRCMNYRVDDPI